MNSKFTKMAILSLVGFGFFGCGEAPQAPKMPPQVVSTMAAKSENVALEFSYPAELISEEDVLLKPKVSGQVVEKLFKAGDLVKKGQVLFLIEPDKFKAAYEVAKSNVSVANSTYANAKKDHDRNRVLIGKQAISQKEYDTSLASFNSATANLESAQAQLTSAQLDYNYTNVSAPFDGVVGDALINVGEYVTASATNLVRVTNLNPIYADFYIADVEKLNLEKQLSNGAWNVESVDASVNFNNENVKGKLYFVDSVIDSNSGKVKAKAIFDNTDGKLLPGIFTTITMNGFVQKNGYKLPSIALMQDARNTYVYTLDNESKVKKTIVKVVYQTNDFVVISEGLKDGDKVILNNFKKIAPGAVVQDIGGGR